MLKHFSRAEVEKILGIRIGRLRYWDRIGLVKPSLRVGGRPFYDFQDLICLKTAQGLVKKGLPARRVKASVDSLKKRIPEFDGQLSSKRIYVFGSRVLVSHKKRLIDSHSGQLYLKFDLDEFASEVSSGVENIQVERTAGQWFQEGLRLEANEAGRDEALLAYREAVKLDPAFADAYVNMGAIHYARRDFIDAQRCFRLAIRRKPYHAKACFNLANVLDELNCTEESIRWYERALEAEPNFADAYYNLAAAAEKLGLLDRAVRHWKAYLKFDSQSPHAGIARKRIKVLEAELAFKAGHRPGIPKGA